MGHGYRVSQIVKSNGEGCIALIHNDQIVETFTNWKDAKAAYRLATKKSK